MAFRTIFLLTKERIMLKITGSILLALLCLAGIDLNAQTTIRGKLIDALTKEPVSGATIRCDKEKCTCGCTTDAAGNFETRCTDCQNLTATFIGYAPQRIHLLAADQLIEMNPCLRHSLCSAPHRPALVLFPGWFWC